MRLDELFTKDSDNELFRRLVKIIHSDAKNGHDEDIKELNHARDVNDTTTLRRLRDKYLGSEKKEYTKEVSKTRFINKFIMQEIEERMPHYDYLDISLDFAMYNNDEDFKVKLYSNGRLFAITKMFKTDIVDNIDSRVEELYSNIFDELYRLDKRTK